MNKLHEMFEKDVFTDDFDPLEYAWFDSKRNKYIPYSKDDVCLDTSITLNAGWEAWQAQQLRLEKANDALKKLAQKWREQSKEKYNQDETWESKVLGECADELLDELESQSKGVEI